MAIEAQYLIPWTIFTRECMSDQNVILILTQLNIYRDRRHLAAWASAIHWVWHEIFSIKIINNFTRKTDEITAHLSWSYFLHAVIVFKSIISSIHDQLCLLWTLDHVILQNIHSQSSCYPSISDRFLFIRRITEHFLLHNFDFHFNLVSQYKKKTNDFLTLEESKFNRQYSFETQT